MELDDLLRESAWIRRLARSLVRDESTADDLVQETWLAALRRPPRPGAEGRESLRPWLSKVLRNAARMRARGESNRSRREQTAARGEALPGTAELTARAETQQRVGQAVLALDEALRETVLLRYFEGLSSAEIARRTGTPAGTVRWRLKRGLEDLRERLDEQHGDRRTWCLLLVPLAREPAPAWVAMKLAVLVALVGALAVFVPRWIGSSMPAVAGLAASPEVGERGGEGTLPQVPVLAPDSAGALALDRSSRDAAVPGPRVLLQAVDALGRPVPGAVLRTAGSTARADAQGRVSLSGGEGALGLELELSAPGFVTLRETVRAPAGETTELGTWTLVDAGSIAGFVLDESGTGLAGATVSIEVLPGAWGGSQHQPLEEARYLGSLLERGGLRLHEEHTDAAGRFRIDGLPPGYVRVWARAAGRLGAYSEPVPVRAGAVAPCPALMPPRPASGEVISGRVLDPAGQPVPRAGVEAARRSLEARFFAGEPFVFRSQCDELGRFELMVDPSSNYTVAATDGEGRWRAVLDGPHAAGARDLELRLLERHRFELRVTDLGEPLAVGDYDVTLFRSWARTKDAPVPLDLSQLPILEAPHHPFLIRVQTRSLSFANSEWFPAGATPGAVELELWRSPTMGGQVLAGGEPVEGAIVTVLGRRDPPLELERWTLDAEPVQTEWRATERRALTDATGKFEMVFEFPGFIAPTTVRVEPPVSRRDLAPGVFVLAQEPLELQPSGSLDGVFHMPHDRSPAGVIVAATNGDGFFASRRVDAAGRFRFEGLAPGPWQLRRFSREATRSDWRSLFGGRPTTRPARIDAHVRPGETTHVELRWEPPVVFELAGCVRVGDQPPGAWQAKLSSAARKHTATASLGIEGCFELIADAAGRHQLELWNTGYRQVRLNVTDEVMLAAGTTPWSVGWDAGALIVAGAEPEDTLVYRWQLDTLVVEARAVADETGRVEFPSLPAGAGLLTIAGDAGSGREVEVVAGESVELAL